MVNDYDVDNFSIKVVRIVLSYIDYINRTVWKNNFVSTKVLVLGASGMIGHSIYSFLKNINFKVYGLSRSNKVDDEVKILNVKDNDVFETFLKK